MTTLLEQYDAHVSQQIHEIHKKHSYLMRSHRAHDADKCLHQELPRRTGKYADTRAKLVELLADGTKKANIDEALQLFEHVVGKPFEMVVHVQIPRASSPRSFLHTRRLVNMYRKGGPIHPNILAKTMKQKGRVRPEFREATGYYKSQNKKSSSKTRSNRTQ